VRKLAGFLLKGALILACVFAGLIVLTWGVFYYNVRAIDLPPESARGFAAVEPADEILHAYSGMRWLDSQRYAVVKADPARFDARIKKLSATGLIGASSKQVISVHEGPGKDLWHRGESLPSWWDVDSLTTAVAVDVSYGGHTGSLTIFSKERGLIYIVNR